MKNDKLIQKMKLCLIHINGEDKNKINESEVLLRYWIKSNEKFVDKNFDLCLLTDGLSIVPEFWEKQIAIVKYPLPPTYTHVLHRVGWVRAQAFDTVGRCLVMDTDTSIIKPIDELCLINCSISMAKALLPKPAWKEVVAKHNVGVMIQNFKEIWERFRDIYFKHLEHLIIPNYEEHVFGEIFHTIDNAKLLNIKYNYNYRSTHHEKAVILHYTFQQKPKLLKQIANAEKIKNQNCKLFL